MTHRTSIAVLVAVLTPVSLVFVSPGQAHHGPHGDPSPDDPFGGDDGALPPGDPSPAPAVFNDVLGRCRWYRDGATTHTGGPLVSCTPGEFPVTAGVRIPEPDPDASGPVFLSPGWGTWNGVDADSIVEGEPLTDDNHGEPPPDNVHADQFDPEASGTHIHYNTFVPHDDNEVLALCCETVPPQGPGDALRDCRVETSLEPALPDPDWPGQFRASVQCGGGRKIVSGGCMAQFKHFTSDWSLIGSHPWSNSNRNHPPNGAHATLAAQSGWVCRLDREPDIPNYTPDESIAVTALCCN